MGNVQGSRLGKDLHCSVKDVYFIDVSVNKSHMCARELALILATDITTILAFPLKLFNQSSEYASDRGQLLKGSD